MTNKKSEEVLRELRAKAAEYALKSTLLSNQLEEAETFLNELPSKIEITVGQGWDSLTFIRGQSRWRLWIGSDEQGHFTTEAPVARKAVAAKLLPELVSQLFSLLNESLNTVTEGLEALKDVPFLDHSSEEE